MVALARKLDTKAEKKEIELLMREQEEKSKSQFWWSPFSQKPALKESYSTSTRVASLGAVAGSSVVKVTYLNSAVGGNKKYHIVRALL